MLHGIFSQLGNVLTPTKIHNRIHTKRTSYMYTFYTENERKHALHAVYV